MNVFSGVENPQQSLDCLLPLSSYAMTSLAPNPLEKLTGLAIAVCAFLVVVFALGAEGSLLGLVISVVVYWWLLRDPPQIE